MRCELTFRINLNYDQNIPVSYVVSSGTAHTNDVTRATDVNVSCPGHRAALIEINPMS